MKTKKTIRITTLVLLMLCSVSVLAQSVHTQVYDAQTAIAKQDWSTAEVILSSADQANPRNPHVMYEMAQVYENTNRLDKAAKIYADLSTIPEAKLREYLVLVRSANGMQPTNLASLTPISMNRIAAKQATAQRVTPIAPAAAIETPKSMTPETTQKENNVRSVNTAVTSALQNWATAWANKDVPAYFSSYVENFKGNQASSTAWMKSRRTNIEGRKIIELDLSDIRITALSTTKAQINFKLNYVSGTVKELFNKTLLMTKIGDTWLIERESNQ